MCPFRELGMKRNRESARLTTRDARRYRLSSRQRSSGGSSRTGGCGRADDAGVECEAKIGSGGEESGGSCRKRVQISSTDKHDEMIADSPG